MEYVGTTDGAARWASASVLIPGAQETRPSVPVVWVVTSISPFGYSQGVGRDHSRTITHRIDGSGALQARARAWPWRHGHGL